jgi:hypothetical protein
VKTEMSGWAKSLVGLVAAVVLTAAAVIALVVVGTQVGFYRAVMHTQAVGFGPVILDLPVFTPLATEAVVWVCTLMAIVLVILDRPAALWTRSMWFFASIAAFVNAFHAVHINHDLLGGIVTGGLSIAGPFVVHLFVAWVNHLRTGRTLGEARIDTAIRWASIGRALRAVVLTVLDHLVHPVTALRTIWVWRALRGASYDRAWWVAALPLRERLASRYAPRPAEDRAPATVPPVRPDALTEIEPPVDERAHGGVLTAVRADDLGGRDEVAAFVAALNDESLFANAMRQVSQDVRAQDATSGNGRVRDTAARGANTGSDTVRTRPVSDPHKPSGKRSARRSNAAGTGSARDRVTAEYYRRLHAGETTDPAIVDFAELARQMHTHRTTVSRTWRECFAGKRTDPTTDRSNP